MLSSSSYRTCHYEGQSNRSIAKNKKIPRTITLPFIVACSVLYFLSSFAHRQPFWTAPPFLPSTCPEFAPPTPAQNSIRVFCSCNNGDFKQTFGMSLLVNNEFTWAMTSWWSRRCTTGGRPRSCWGWRRRRPCGRGRCRQRGPESGFPIHFSVTFFAAFHAYVYF